MGRQLGRCKKCNCQATIEERDNGVCIWCSARKLENEDISWLLNEISALRAELARVKAESLRVVVDGEACKVLDLVTIAYFTDKGNICRKTGETWGDAGPEYCSFEELKTEGTHGQMTAGFIVQPVRLERWEDE